MQFLAMFFGTHQSLDRLIDKVAVHRWRQIIALGSVDQR